MVTIHNIVFMSVDAAAVSLSPPNISAKLSALDAVGIAAMINKAMTTKRSSGKIRSKSSRTPRLNSGDRMSLTAATRYTFGSSNIPGRGFGAGTVSDDTAALLSQAMTISGQTGGLFDCSIAPVMQAWGLPREITVSRITETETITTGEPGAQNTIQVSGEGIAVIAADCPDQVCVRQGVRAHGSAPIVCLPNRLSIRFSDGTAEALPDAVSGTGGN